MAKLKSPLLGLEVHGTVGNSLTFQHRNHTDFVREKPIPKDPQTLAQIYHRWDYQDAIIYWSTLSAATKAQWRTVGSRHHMTAFAAFLSDYLLTLPDLVGRWRLDEAAGAIAYDSSKQGNNGTIIGAIPAAGLISGARYFDGLNDRINCGNSPLFNLTNALTIACIINTSAVGFGDIVSRFSIVGTTRCFSLFVAPPQISFRCSRDGLAGGTAIFFGPPVADGNYHTIVCTYDLVTCQIIVDGTLFSGVLNNAIHSNPAVDLELGRQSGCGGYYDGILDHVYLSDYIWPTPRISAYSERRYPQ